MKKRLLIIGTAVVLLLIAAGVSYYFLSRAAPTDTTTPKALPQVSATTESFAPAEQSILPSKESQPLPKSSLTPFEQKIESLKQAVADVCDSSERKALTLIFTETEVNDQASDHIKKIEIPADIPLELESIHLYLEPDNNVLIQARSVLYGKLKVTIKATAQVSVEAGKPKVEITKVSFGFIPLPGILKDRIVGLATSKIDDLQKQITEADIGCNGKVGMEFTDITIQQDKLTISVLLKPRR